MYKNHSIVVTQSDTIRSIRSSVGSYLKPVHTMVTSGDVYIVMSIANK